MHQSGQHPAPQLGAEVAKVVLGETKALNGGVDEVIVGQVLQAAVGQNPARQVALGAGVPDSINAWTINKVCGSSLESVMQANRAIRCGDAKVVLAGGIESMSMAPFYVPSRARAGLTERGTRNTSTSSGCSVRSHVMYASSYGPGSSESQKTSNP